MQARYHEHNHKGQCWWEIRKADDPSPIQKPGEVAGEKDIELQPNWKSELHHIFDTTLKSRKDATKS